MINLNILPFFIFLIIQHINSFLIGVDLGSEFFKVTVIKPGKPFSMMENLQSKTKTLNAIGLKDNPGFMVPRKVIGLDNMPRLSNGKIDMQALKNYKSNK